MRLSEVNTEGTFESAYLWLHWHTTPVTFSLITAQVWRVPLERMYPFTHKHCCILRRGSAMCFRRLAPSISTEHNQQHTLSWPVGNTFPGWVLSWGFQHLYLLLQRSGSSKEDDMYCNPTQLAKAVFFVGDQFSGWVGKPHIKLSCPVPRTSRQLVASCEQFLSCDYVDCDFFHSFTGIFDLKNSGFCGQSALSLGVRCFLWFSGPRSTYLPRQLGN